jgi:hypothetical protein
MPRSLLAAALGLAALAALPLPARPDQPTAPVRKLLYPTDPRELPAALKPHVEQLLAGGKPIEPADAKFSGVYLRVVSRKHVLDGAKLKPDGWLGGRPFVFLTVPEAAYGRDLLGTLSAIGYDPEDILDREKGVEKVAVVFTFPDAVRPGDVKDGALPDDWDRRVYAATWNTVFALLDRMTASKDRCVVRPNGDTFDPTRFQFREDKELAFAIGFPNEGKCRVRGDYAALRETGGADWVYRQLIERLFGCSEHFRGDGRTKLTLVGKGKPRDGFPEFLGPNTELKDVPVLAVVGLGALRVGE